MNRKPHHTVIFCYDQLIILVLSGMLWLLICLDGELIEGLSVFLILGLKMCPRIYRCAEFAYACMFSKVIAAGAKL